MDVIVEGRVIESVVQALQGELQRLGERGLLFRRVKVAEGGGMAPGDDPGLERRAGRVRGKDREGLVLENDAGTGAQLVLERAAADALGLRLMRAPSTRQIEEQARRQQGECIKLSLRE